MHRLREYIYMILECIFNFIFILVFIIAMLAIYYTAQTKILKKDYANILGYTIFEVATGSMSRTIDVGDIVLVKLTDKVQEDDIIVYQEDRAIITHRLVEVNNDYLVTKGDANSNLDSPIQKEQVIGKVIYTIKGVSILKKVLLTPEIIISIAMSIIFIGIILMLPEKNNK